MNIRTEPFWLLNVTEAWMEGIDNLGHGVKARRPW